MIFTDGPYLTKAEAERFYANLKGASAQWKAVNARDVRALRILRLKALAQRMLVALAIGIVLGVLFSV